MPDRPVGDPGSGWGFYSAAVEPALSGIAPIVVSAIIGAVVIHEFLGPVASKLALKAGGEIKANAGD